VKRARYAMGLDGGGSTIRVAIVEPDLTVVGESQAGTVNPSVVGQTAAAELIRRAMREALAAARRRGYRSGGRVSCPLGRLAARGSDRSDAKGANCAQL